MRRSKIFLGFLGLVAASAGCDESSTPDWSRGVTPDVVVVAEPDVPFAAPDTVTAPVEPVAAAPALRRLTSSQYRNVLRDWFGKDLVVPSTLEPDARTEGLYAVGASVNGISSLGVEQYFQGAKSMANQLIQLAPLREKLFVCDRAPDADACLGTLVDTWSLRLWRRPASEAERGRLLGVGHKAIEALGNFDEGVRYIMTALLASPHFVYVHGTGAAGDADVRPYTSFEMATRLALFLWSSGPDDLLLQAAARDELLDTQALRALVRGMLDDPRARRGIRAFAEEWLELDGLTRLSKDPDVYAYFSPDIGAQAREETLSLVEHLVFERDADFRTLLTTRTTFVNPRLAALYGVPAGSVEGFAQVTLPADGPRSGLLGHASLLALHASPARSSPTLRGLFVRERLLCQPMPSPPANVDTTIPESSIDAPTMRERLKVHLESPTCAGCHALTDLIGLGLERFDGLGGYRATEAGAVIDPSGDLDGAPFEDARSLGETLAVHPALVECVVETLWRYANGRLVHDGEAAETTALRAQFVSRGHSLKALLEEIAVSEGFRRVGAVSLANPGSDADADTSAGEGAE